MDSLECRKCHMYFTTKELLANHVAKFCSDSEYGDPIKLKALPISISQIRLKMLCSDYGSFQELFPQAKLLSERRGGEGARGDFLNFEDVRGNQYCF